MYGTSAPVSVFSNTMPKLVPMIADCAILMASCDEPFPNTLPAIGSFPVGHPTISVTTVARRSDGSVVRSNGGYVPELPAGLTYVEVAMGLYHVLARRSDGSAVACHAVGASAQPVRVLPRAA